MRRLWPPISFGCPSPIASKIVGATSPKTPSVFFKLHPLGALAMMKGTLLVVCEVLGVPSSVSISSAFLEALVTRQYGTNIELTHDLQSQIEYSPLSCKLHTPYQWLHLSLQLPVLLLCTRRCVRPYRVGQSYS